jgi:predicted PurR-regulated permease PerM
MNEMHRDLLSGAFSVAVIGLAAFVTQRFFLPLVWAGVLCVATWPLYKRMVSALGNRALLAALLLTLICASVFIVPVLLSLAQIVKQAPAIADFIANANNNGIAPPELLMRIPQIGNYIHNWWLATLDQPHGLSHLFSGNSFSRFHSASDVLKAFGTQLFHRLIDFGFAFLCLFFFYKDGEILDRQIVAIGSRCFGADRWKRYAKRIPTAIRATVNGLVLVGLAEGVLIGIGYSIAGIASPAIWAAITGALAIIPFGAPIAYLSAAVLLVANGAPVSALGLVVWGSLVLFVADHFIRPTMIGNATRLPFLAVLIGILGGVETMGLLGLFIGPVIMVLFVTLWHETQLIDKPAGTSL